MNSVFRPYGNLPFESVPTGGGRLRFCRLLVIRMRLVWLAKVRERVFAFSWRLRRRPSFVVRRPSSSSSAAAAAAPSASEPANIQSEKIIFKRSHLKSIILKNPNLKKCIFEKSHFEASILKKSNSEKSQGAHVGDALPAVGDTPHFCGGAATTHVGDALPASRKLHDGHRPVPPQVERVRWRYLGGRRRRRRRRRRIFVSN